MWGHRGEIQASVGPVPTTIVDWILLLFKREKKGGCYKDYNNDA
jgi:hypothetical protein